MAGSVTVVSPHLGNAFPAEIIAFDDRVDLAVLKSLTKGHPAYALARDDALLAAERIQVVGLPDVVQNLHSLDAMTPTRLLTPRSQELPLEFVAVGQGMLRFLSLSETGDLQRGWSGSAALLPGTTSVAGCFTKLTARRHGTTTEIISAQAAAVARVRRLLAQGQHEGSLALSGFTLPRPADAGDAFLVCARTLGHLMKNEAKPALTSSEAFRQLRPHCSFGYRVSAYAASSLKNDEQAESLYRQALSISPEDLDLKLRYVQFLSLHGRAKEALPLLDELWRTGRRRPEVAIFFFNILAKGGEFARCAQLTKEALKDNPQNAHLWANLGLCQAQTDELEGAISSYARAAELLPEAPRFSIVHAGLLARDGRLDEAEQLFRQQAQDRPDDAVARFSLADFLARHRPASTEEAIELAEQALRLPRHPELPKAVVRRFIENVRAGRPGLEGSPSEPGPAEVTEEPAPETPDTDEDEQEPEQKAP